MIPLLDWPWWIETPLYLAAGVPWAGFMVEWFGGHNRKRKRSEYAAPTIYVWNLVLWPLSIALFLTLALIVNVVIPVGRGVYFASVPSYRKHVRLLRTVEVDQQIAKHHEVIWEGAPPEGMTIYPDERPMIEE